MKSQRKSTRQWSVALAIALGVFGACKDQAPIDGVYQDFPSLAPMQPPPAPQPLAPPTNCQIQKQPPFGTPVYLRVTWTNSGEGAPTEVYINRNGIETQQPTQAPGNTQYYYSLGSPPQTGLFYARVRHALEGYEPSTSCYTGTTSVP